MEILDSFFFFFNVRYVSFYVIVCMMYSSFAKRHIRYCLITFLKLLTIANINVWTLLKTILSQSHSRDLL